MFIIVNKYVSKRIWKNVHNLSPYKVPCAISNRMLAECHHTESILQKPRDRDAVVLHFTQRIKYLNKYCIFFKYILLGFSLLHEYICSGTDVA
jgi:hypothetical protein